jgi:uncharacterized protein YjbI with pentapeptide repeats
VDLRGADLRGANLVGTHLEGVINAEYAFVLDSHRVVFLFPLICFALVQLLLFFPLIFPLIYLFQFAYLRDFEC